MLGGNKCYRDLPEYILTFRRICKFFFFFHIIIHRRCTNINVCTFTTYTDVIAGFFSKCAALQVTEAIEGIHSGCAAHLTR